MNEAPSLAERYLVATTSKNLKQKQGPCDVDKLLAAGYATSGDSRKTLALSLWRMRETGDHGGFAAAVAELVAWARARQARRRQQQVRLTQETARRVVWLWLHQNCPVCHGRGHPVIPDTPMTDWRRECQHCSGTGKNDISKIVTGPQLDLARAIMDEIDRLTGMVFDDMARMLKADLDL